MNITPDKDSNIKNKGESRPPVYKKRVLDSKDIDFIIQYYVQNLNKQSTAYTKKKRKKNLIALVPILVILLIFATYKVSVMFFGDFFVGDAKKTELKLDSSGVPEVKQITPRAERTRNALAGEVKKTSSQGKSVAPKKKISTARKVVPKKKISTARKVVPKKKISTARKVVPKKKISTARKVVPKKKISTARKVVPKKKQLASLVAKKKRSFFSKNSNIKVSKMVMCEGVKALKPVNPKNTFSVKRVYCWVKLKAKKVPYKVNFTFYYGGKWIYRYTTNVRNKNAVTWCYKTIWEKGEWLVRLTDEYENLVASKTFFHD